MKTVFVLMFILVLAGGAYAQQQYAPPPQQYNFPAPQQYGPPVQPYTSPPQQPAQQQYPPRPESPTSYGPGYGNMSPSPHYGYGNMGSSQ